MNPSDLLTLVRTYDYPNTPCAPRPCEENPAYRDVEIEWIEDERESEAARRYTDYYYVPTIYIDGQKLYEAHPGDDYKTIKANVKKALDAVV